MTVKQLFASAIALALSSMAWAEHRPNYPDVYKLPAWVDQVQRVCPWRSQAGEGYIRVMRTEYEGRHGLYLQWIRKGIAGSPTQATSTVLVKELDQDYHVKLMMPEAKLSKNTCELTALGESMLNERRYQFHFTLKGPGDYQFRATHLLEGGL